MSEKMCGKCGKEPVWGQDPATGVVVKDNELCAGCWTHMVFSFVRPPDEHFYPKTTITKETILASASPGPAEPEGMSAWMDPKPDAEPFFGVDRTERTGMTREFKPRPWPIRITDAWRGLVEGWKWGD